MTKLIALAGMPGSGKTTWAKRFFPLEIISADEIRIEQYGSLRAAHDDPEKSAERNKYVFDVFHGRLTMNLLSGASVVADETALTVLSRENLRRVAAFAGAEPHLFVFENDIQAFERNRKREPDLIVPEEVMDRMHRQYKTFIEDLRDGEFDKWASVTFVEPAK